MNVPDTILTKIKVTLCLQVFCFLHLKKACTHSSMMELKKCLITVVLNVQNFGNCLSFIVSSVAGFD
jgi:hypothetical protein